MSKSKVQNRSKHDEYRKIYTNEFNNSLDKMVNRALEIPVTYILNAPQVYLAEATQCYIWGFFSASMALSRSTLEQVLKDKLNIDKREIIDLTCLIKLGIAQNILRNELKSNAIKVQKWANAYIHDTVKKDPDYKKQQYRSKEILLSLKKIIEALYPNKNSKTTSGGFGGLRSIKSCYSKSGFLREKGRKKVS